MPHNPASMVEDTKVTVVQGLSGPGRSYFISRIVSSLDRPCILLFPSFREAEQGVRELTFFLWEDHKDIDEKRLFHFRPYDVNPLSGLSPDPRIIKDRIEALYGLLYLKNPIVCTSVEAIAFACVPKDVFKDSLEYLEAGQDLDRGHLIETLEQLGYERVGLVEDIGEYSVRGGVVDIYAPIYPNPIRVEVWGDRAESIRVFDPLTQRSQGLLTHATILPVREVIRTKEAIERSRKMGRLPHPGGEGRPFSGEEVWLNHFYDKLGHLFQYGAQSLFILIDPNRFEGAYERVAAKFQNDIGKYKEEASLKGEPFPILGGFLCPFEPLQSSLEEAERVLFFSIPLEDLGKKHQLLQPGIQEISHELNIRLAGKRRLSLSPLAQKVEEWKRGGGRVVIVVRTQQQALRLKEILRNYQVEIEGVLGSWKELCDRAGVYICLGRLSSGFKDLGQGLYVLCEDEIFGSKREHGTKRGSREQLAALAGDLKTGDLVVHEEHGIGRYIGLTRLKVGEQETEFVIIQYANNDKLYIPADRVSILQKYIGTEGIEPRLDQLGGRSWDLARKTARRSVQKIAKQLVELYAIRQARKGIAYSPPDGMYREFEATFEHEETPDQTKAIEEVLEDMMSERPMDRLICGDVGFGKTEVALRAAFKAVSDGKQVAILVPTTVLAEQHYRTFRSRMEPFGVRVEVLSRFKGPAQQKDILARTREGQVQVLIGTHRLLQKDVKFADLGLLIIDEEQRFGVKQKELIKTYRSMVDVLSMTATPIPRTLQMSLLGIRELSIIETPPENRLSIQTTVSLYDEDLIRDGILSELDRGGQVFFVHNTVYDIEEVASRLKELVPEARIDIAHGQLKERELEKAMLRFLEMETQVLVCTSIIESGLDIPTANTIFIDEVERMGLAQIYQLRGRVGRSSEKAYAYLLVRDPSRLTREAEKRLKALMEFSELGAGLQLALHDLKIRGGGNILGFAQHGHIALVGYEMYIRMIQEAIAELKGEELEEEINPELNVGLQAYIPGNYVSDADTRLGLYRRLSSLREESQLEDIKKEFEDRFGPIPPYVENLFWVMLLRIICREKAITKLELGKDSLTITFHPKIGFTEEKAALLGKRGAMRTRLIQKDRLRIFLPRLTMPQDKHRIVELLKAI